MQGAKLRYFLILMVAIGAVLFQNMTSIDLYGDKGKEEFPIIFQKTKKACYRIPSLVYLKNTYVAISQKRYELNLNGEILTCNDDGNIDLVLKTSEDNGKTWSIEKTLISQKNIRDNFINPKSAFYDPYIDYHFKKSELNNLFIKFGAQSASHVDGKLVVVFGAFYNVRPKCNKGDCINSPENAYKGFSKGRYFKGISSDLGNTWNFEKIHDEVLNACVDLLIKDQQLKTKLSSLFPQENFNNIQVELIEQSVFDSLDKMKFDYKKSEIRRLLKSKENSYRVFFNFLEKSKLSRNVFIKYYYNSLIENYNRAITKAIWSSTGSENDALMDSRHDDIADLGSDDNISSVESNLIKEQKVAKILGVPVSTVKKYYKEISFLLLEAFRAGPGNASVVLLPNGKKRLVVPAAPLGFYSDDEGKSWQCSDTTKVTTGSERQIAFLENGFGVMALRNKVDYRKVENMYRRFSVSKDYGVTWSQGEFLFINDQKVLADPIANGGLISVDSSDGKVLLMSNLANNRDYIENKNKTNKDKRLRLSITHFEPDSVIPVLKHSCDKYGQVYKSQFTLWPGTASYSVLESRENQHLGILFEATRNSPNTLEYRGWHEAIRFAEIPMRILDQGNPLKECNKE